MSKRSSLGRSVAIGVLVAAVAAIGLGPSLLSSDALVVYCAHDEQFASQILRDFESETGIRVAVVYDTEATKSLGLVNLIAREQRHPRCDIFWNNELLGTLDLARQGFLLPYQGPGWQRMPPHARDPEGLWAGFAARLRVVIVNTNHLEPDEERVAARLDENQDLSRVAIARPLYGTTLTHYALLRQAWGAERLKAWHHDTRRRGLREVAGNAATKDLVAGGACDMGFTDTDDYFVAHDAKRPVAMVPVRIGGRTVAIPNTVAILRGTGRAAQAKRLVDYLLSEHTELKLARSASRQIPLGAVASESLPEDVKPLAEWAAQGADLRGLLPERAEVIRWLTAEYLQ
jgi:iron(III) transport system substrate-binding protein